MKDKAHLTLLKPNKEATIAEVYGSVFNLMVDQIYAIKEQANQLYLSALESGIDPEEMLSEHSLVELDLAEYTNVSTLDGVPKVRYFNPEAQRVKHILMHAHEEDE